MTNQNNRRWATTGAVIAVIVFITMLGGMLTKAGWLTNFDRTIRQLVFSWQPTWWTASVKAGTQLFNSRQVLLILVVGALIISFLASYRDAVFFMTATILGILINTTIKLLVRRPRPTDHVLMKYGGFSFPSGHSIAVTVICGALMVIICRHCHPAWRRYLIDCLLTLLIIFIGYSRIYVSAHYPSDVLGGWSLGYLVLFINWHWFYGKIKSRSERWIKEQAK